METKKYTKLKKQIIDLMTTENIYDEIDKALENESQGCVYVAENCAKVDDIEYFFDVTGTVTKESYSEEGTTGERISYKTEIEYELTNCYYYIRNKARKINFQVTGILTDTQIKTINELL